MEWANDTEFNVFIIPTLINTYNQQSTHSHNCVLLFHTWPPILMIWYDTKIRNWLTHEPVDIFQILFIVEKIWIGFSNLDDWLRVNILGFLQ